MLYLKACPRCKGDIVCDCDMYGAYLECLQCGFVRDLAGSRKREASSNTEAHIHNCNKENCFGTHKRL